MNEHIKEMANIIPDNIISYNGNPQGQHIYAEQREDIAKELYKAGYRKESDTAEKILTYLYAKMGNSALSDTELIKALAIQYDVEIDK